MKKKILALLLALVLCLGLLPAAAAAAGVTEVLAPGTYEIQSNDFCDGLARVRVRDGSSYKYGYIDAAGKLVIPCQYAGAEDFHDGLARVSMDGETWGQIDKTGKEVFPFMAGGEYFDFTEGLAPVCSAENGKWGFMNLAGELAVPFKYGTVWAFSSGMAKVYDSAEGYYGYVDKTGREIPCQYAQAWDFVNGYALVQIGRTTNIIDTTGKTIIPDGYYYQDSWPKDFSASGVMLVSATEGYFASSGENYLMDMSGRIVSEPLAAYDYGINFHEGLAKVTTFLNGNGFIDTTGKEVIPLGQYNIVSESFVNGYAKVSIMEWVDGFRRYHYGFIDKTGELVLELRDPAPASEGENFYEGRLAVRSDASGRTRYGFVDATGKEVVPCKYAEVKRFCGGVAAVKNFENLWGFIDAEGKELIPCQYVDVEYSAEEGVFFVYSRKSSAFSSGEVGLVIASRASAPVVTEPDPKPTAAASTQSVLLDGKDVTFYAYEIADYNYVKLRDLAFALSGSAAQFEVGWDEAANRITLTSGKAYTPAPGGGEMNPPSAPGAQPYEAINSTLVINGKTVALTAYTINGYNYFKLRDLGENLGFNVSWINNRIVIASDEPYDAN